jgi:hypothetical protein
LLRNADWSARNPVDPPLRAGERARERVDLAGVATGGARLLRLVESVDALGRGEGFKGGVPRIDRPNAAAVTPLRRVPGRIGFRKQPASVERDEVDVETGLADVMNDDLALQSEAGGENDPAAERIAEAGQPLGHVKARKRATKTGLVQPRCVGPFRRQQHMFAILMIDHETENIVRRRLRGSFFQEEPHA